MEQVGAGKRLEMGRTEGHFSNSLLHAGTTYYYYHNRISMTAGERVMHAFPRHVLRTCWDVIEYRDVACIPVAYT